MKYLFRQFASKISQAAGSPATFFIACSLIFSWALTGPLFNYSATWQLVINTLTTIITFLMVFLIQNTQNRDTKAVHLKLDEIIRGLKGTRNSFINIEDQADEEIDELLIEFQKLHDRYLRQLKSTQKKRLATIKKNNNS